MIRELINFTENLSDDFKSLAILPSKGVHIFVKEGGDQKLEVSRYVYYDGKEITDESKDVVFYEKYSSYITMNKQQKFDPNQKIHSSSPYSFAFNFSLGNSKKEVTINLKEEIQKETGLAFGNKSLTKEQNKHLTELLDSKIKNFKIDAVKDSISNYFKNAKSLCLKDDKNNHIIKKFESFCLTEFWDKLSDMEIEKEISKETKSVKVLPELKEKDYVRVYLLDVEKNDWKIAYDNYYCGEYPKEEYAAIDFMANYPTKKPFKLHQTASFDSFKITGNETAILKEFKTILLSDNQILPKPLPIFIYADENFNTDFFKLCTEDEERLTYREIIENLYKKHKSVFQNYYLMYWYKAKDVEINDFDFVPKFQYELDLEIQNLFELKEEKRKKHYPKIKTIFQLEDIVFKNLIENKYHKVDYFSDLKKDDYERRNLTFLSFCKYRKAVYDYVYKSNRNTIGGKEFNEMIFNAIKDDLKNGNEYGIKEKLNFWYSLYNEFNQQNNTLNMASKLKEYQQFVDELITETANTETCTDEHFAFAAGQVIYCLLDKSKSDDKSFRLMEPYLQKTNCKALQENITEDFKRYNHETFSDNFEKVAAFVLSYETNVNIKKLQPQLLSGLFAHNQLS